uniref:Uncharacterized protein n=1 Tax=Rhizophora mucronata TaxID=61149 RepID=A0A2P2PH77_RHIMU
MGSHSMLYVIFQFSPLSKMFGANLSSFFFYLK